MDATLADPSLKTKEMRRIWRNIFLISLSCLCNFTAYQSAYALQSSLNPEEGLGTASLTVIYATFMISALFLPTCESNISTVLLETLVLLGVINYLGCKKTMVLSICGYVTYPLANFYPHWGTLIPSSLIVGLSSALLWSAKCTYLTTAAEKYVILANEPTGAVLNRFFGVFFLFFQLAQIIGNLISSFVLSADSTNNLEFPTCYKTFIEEFCGKNDCQEDLGAARRQFNSSGCSVTNLDSSGPSDSTIYTLMGIYAALSISGALVMAVGVDRIKIRARETRGPSAFIATFKLMKDKTQLLLIPITVFSGIQQAFLAGDFTRSFITCPLGVNWVGFVLICFAASGGICSLLFARVEKHVKRLPLFTAATVIFSSLIITFLMWTPYPDEMALFFIFPAFWGFADIMWQVQINSLYGVLFASNQEAAFANSKFLSSLGFVITFANQICVSVKLWAMLAILTVSMSMYYCVEFLERKTGQLAKKDVATAGSPGRTHADIKFTEKRDSCITNI